jgi:hypothetical protein
MVELVRSEVAHMSADPLSVTKMRSEVVEFADPFIFIR